MKEIETVEQVYDRIAPNMSKARGKKDVAMTVAKVYADQFQQKWIKIESESDLPPINLRVLVLAYPKTPQIGGEKVISIDYVRPYKHLNGLMRDRLEITNGFYNNVTHWMPLPHPIKED